MPKIAGSRHIAHGILAALLLGICPVFALAQSGIDPMAALDLQFDQKRVVEIIRLRKQIADLGGEIGRAHV